MKEPTFHEVNRAQLRQNQRMTLKLARGSEGVIIRSQDREEDKIILDKRYFDDLSRYWGSLTETLDVIKDHRLFKQILAGDEMLEENLRLGKLHSLDDAFADE